MKLVDRTQRFHYHVSSPNRYFHIMHVLSLYVYMCSQLYVCIL